MPDFKDLPPKPTNKKNKIPFVTTYMSNLDTKPIVNSIRTLVSNKKTSQLQEVFNDVKIVVAYKQPKNIKRLVTKAKFSDSETNTDKIILLAIFASCKDMRCNLCFNGYIQEWLYSRMFFF